MTDNLKEREAFEAEFPPPYGVAWNGSSYSVEDEYINSYRCDRFVGKWDAWKARAAIDAAPAARGAVPADIWPTYEAAIADPLFQQARGIMGTQTFGQDDALRRAILHVLTASPKPQPQPLTDEQISELRKRWFRGNLTPETIFHRGVRAAEEAHRLQRAAAPQPKD